MYSLGHGGHGNRGRMVWLYSLVRRGGGDCFVTSWRSFFSGGHLSDVWIIRKLSDNFGQFSFVPVRQANRRSWAASWRGCGGYGHFVHAAWNCVLAPSSAIFFKSLILKIGKSWSAFQFAFLNINKIKLFCKRTCFQRVRKLLDNCCSPANFLRWSCWMMLLQLICRFSVLSLVRGPGSIYFMILILSLYRTCTTLGLLITKFGIDIDSVGRSYFRR